MLSWLHVENNWFAYKATILWNTRCTFNITFTLRYFALFCFFFCCNLFLQKVVKFDDIIPLYSKQMDLKDCWLYLQRSNKQFAIQLLLSINLLHLLKLQPYFCFFKSKIFDFYCSYNIFLRNLWEWHHRQVYCRDVLYILI